MSTIVFLAIRAADLRCGLPGPAPGNGGLMLIYHCPTTARVVHSSVEASEADVRRLGALRLSLWCPHCQLGHAILGKDTQVVADIESAGA